MVGNIGSKIETDASSNIGVSAIDGDAAAANVTAEVESFQARINAVKQDAAVNASSGDAMIARGNELVTEGEQELNEKGPVGGLISAVPGALEEGTKDVPIVGAITGLVANVADAVGGFFDNFFVGGEPPPPPPENVAATGVAETSTTPETLEIGDEPEEKIDLGHQLIAEGKALNDAKEASA